MNAVAAAATPPPMPPSTKTLSSLPPSFSSFSTPLLILSLIWLDFLPAPGGDQGAVSGHIKNLGYSCTVFDRAE
ncbi:hypothetical protein MUK42_04395 [Musa troglodytarum]|uniref:Uncharacterized protein n=1 Tax=Musa troglodytarum TaxID=320322 RepID=A0A9E7KG28_9LILI|nr:hypothetical protein MUK42_04395 [Musa troglodytarum]